MFVRIHKLHSVSAAPRVLGLLAAVWVGLAFQPCAVAAPAEQHCPNCPTEVAVDLAPVDDHCGTKAKDTQTVSASCASVQSDCGDIDDGIVNLRVESDDFDQDISVVPTCMPSSRLSTRLRESIGSTIGPPYLSGGSVPLFILNCVYLK